MKGAWLVPDFYPQFSCKMGACRSACCVGWAISMSMTDYFRLLGVACQPDLRERLDHALRLKLHPDPDAYAEINPRYDGNCPLRMADGRCRVHAELGEGALPLVCRLYPRAPKTQGGRECGCANSCEAVLELLLKREAPLRFVELPLRFNLPPEAPRAVRFETLGREQEIRLWLIGLMQDRRFPLPQRLMRMGRALRAMDDALNARDAAEVMQLLSAEDFGEPLPPPDEEAREAALRAAERLLAKLTDASESVRPYGESALACLCGNGELVERYHVVRTQFERAYPHWELWFEHMLVNHMFFSRFPFQDRPVGLRDEFVALCAVYAVLRLLCAGWMGGHAGTDALVDVCAAAFRLIDHTEFDRYAAPVLEQAECVGADRLAALVGV